jgi:hypothetical protein
LVVASSWVFYGIEAKQPLPRGSEYLIDFAAHTKPPANLASSARHGAMKAHNCRPGDKYISSSWPAMLNEETPVLFQIPFTGSEEREPRLWGISFYIFLSRGGEDVIRTELSERAQEIILATKRK